MTQWMTEWTKRMTEWRNEWTSEMFEWHQMSNIQCFQPATSGAQRAAYLSRLGGWRWSRAGSVCSGGRQCGVQCPVLSGGHSGQSGQAVRRQPAGQRWEGAAQQTSGGRQLPSQRLLRQLQHTEAVSGQLSVDEWYIYNTQLYSWWSLVRSVVQWHPAEDPINTWHSSSSGRALDRQSRGTGFGSPECHNCHMYRVTVWLKSSTANRDKRMLVHLRWSTINLHLRSISYSGQLQVAAEHSQHEAAQ